MASSDRSVVLIVDDNQDLRGLLRRVLIRAGYEVLEAWSSERALEILTSHRVDIAVSDHHLSGKDGLWLSERIKGSFPSVATLFMSGDAAALGAARGLALDGYIAKPFDPQGIVQAIEHALARHRGKHPASRSR